MFLLAHFCEESTGQMSRSRQSHDSKGVKMPVRSKETGGYVDVKCKQKGVNGRLSEQRSVDESY